MAGLMLVHEPLWQGGRSPHLGLGPKSPGPPGMRVVAQGRAYCYNVCNSNRTRSPMKSLILYSTIVGGFFAQTEALEAAVDAARTAVGEDVWKRGYSGAEPQGATVAANRELKKAGISALQLEGELIHVGFVENRDAQGNSYPKLRVGVQSFDDQFLLSLDLKGDVAQRLIVKLDNCQPGDYVKISAWPTLVPRGDRQYVNHAASMKGSDGKEVPATSTFSAQVKQQTDGVEAALRSAGVNDKKVISTAKATKRVEAHKELLLKIQARFVESKAAA